MHYGKMLLASIIVLVACLQAITVAADAGGGTGADNKNADVDTAEVSPAKDNAARARQIAERAARAAEAMEENRKAWQAVAKEYRRCKSSSKVAIRLAAVELLRGIDLPKPAAHLCAHVLKDNSGSVARTAAEILGRFGSDPAMEVVVEQLEHGRDNRLERVALLAESLANMHNPRVVAVLAGFLQDKHESMKLIGLMGLTHFSRLDPVLLDLVAPIIERGNDPYLRFTAVQVLARIPAVETIPVLIHAVKSGGMGGAAALLVLEALTHIKAGRNAGAWEKWYSKAMRNGKLPRLHPAGGILNILSDSNPECDTRQTDSYSRMLHNKLGLAEIAGWDSSITDGKRSKFTYSVKPPPVHRLEIVDTGPALRTGGKHKHGSMEIIPLYNGYRIHPATSRQWQELLRKTRESGLDLVIVIDSTSSMGPEIQQVKSIFESCARKLMNIIPDTRIGFVTYRDRPEIRFEDEYVVRGEPLSDRLGIAVSFLSCINAGGGGDLPEAVDEGLCWATQKSGFRARARKVVIIVGDAPPHREYVARTLQLAVTFNQSCQGIVSTVHCGGEEIPELTEIARKGGGQAYLLYQHQAVIRGIFNLVFGQEYAQFMESTF